MGINIGYKNTAQLFAFCIFPVWAETGDFRDSVSHSAMAAVASGNGGSGSAGTGVTSGGGSSALEQLGFAAPNARHNRNRDRKEGI